VCVAFGADDFARDDRARLEVTLLRQQLHDAGLVELGFGVSDGGRVWCMAVQTDDDERLTDAVLDACRGPSGSTDDAAAGARLFFNDLT